MSETRVLFSSWPSINTTVPKYRMRVISMKTDFFIILPSCRKHEHKEMHVFHRSTRPVQLRSNLPCWLRGSTPKSLPFEVCTFDTEHQHSFFCPIWTPRCRYAAKILSLIPAAVLMTLHTDCMKPCERFQNRLAEPWIASERRLLLASALQLPQSCFSRNFSFFARRPFLQKKKKILTDLWSLFCVLCLFLSSASAPTWAKIATVCYHQIHSPPLFFLKKRSQFE